jgi:uncharacterized membrane protein (DUF373 family)
MADENADEGYLVQISTSVFRHLEHVVYAAIGCLLAIGAFLALGGAAVALWQGLGDWTGSSATLIIIDRLLFVLLLTEILHTVRASIRSGGLTCSPFLIVGVIASIRRVLVITLQTSEATKPGTITAEAQAVVQTSMLELAVLGGLILVLVTSLYLLNRIPTPTSHD